MSFVLRNDYICGVMYRIRLSRNEKQVLRLVAGGQGICPAEYPEHIFNAAVRSLHNAGLLQGAFSEGGGVVDSHLTQYGRQYIAENPRLSNPTDWTMWTAVAAAASILISVIALLVACNKLC